MIKPNELRIGNWVARYAYYQHQFIGFERVKELDAKEKIYGDLPSSYCSPIPLTPEVLAMIGFKEIKDYDDGQWLQIPDSDFMLHYVPGKLLALRGPGDTLYLPFKTLHNLQNWWSITTGKEMDYVP